MSFTKTIATAALRCTTQFGSSLTASPGHRRTKSISLLKICARMLRLTSSPSACGTAPLKPKDGLSGPPARGARFLADRVSGLPLLVRLPRYRQPRVERNVHVREFNQVFPDGLRFAHPAPAEPSIHFASELLDDTTRPFRVSFPFRGVLLHATHHNRRRVDHSSRVLALGRDVHTS